MFEAPRQIEPAVIATHSFAPRLAPVAQIDFRHIRSAIWRDKATILATTIASLLLMVLFILLVPHRYTAVAQILIDPTDLHAVANELTPASQVSDTALLQVESQVRVLSSDIVLRRVVKAQALDHDAEFVGSPSLPRRLLAAFGLGGGRTADPMLAALTALKRAVQAKRAERTYVVDVSVSSRSPEKAARLANAVTQAYLAEQTAVRAAAARQVSDSLSARLNELKDRVRESEERAEAFKARNNIVDANGQLINEQQLSELNNQLGGARAHTAEAKARLDQIERLQRSKGDIGAFPQAVQSPTITALRSQYAEIVRREAEQMTALGPRHPAVIDIEAQAERLRRMIGEEVNRIALAARNEYESAQANEQALARNLEALKHNAITTNEAMVTLRELERDVQASRAVYESFLVRARETGEQERLDTKNIRVISQADLPLNRSFPPSNTLLILAALILGVAAGSGIVVARMPGEQGGAPRPRREPSTVAKLSLPAPAKPPAVPVLAALPSIDAASGRDVAGDPKSPFAARIRKVHDALRAGHNNGEHPSILVVAGDGADDTVAVALGLAAVAALSERVLLIDADLERRTLSAFAADQGDGGLVDVAVGRRALADVVVRDRETNINMMPFVSPRSRRGREIKDEDIKLAFAQTKSFELVIVAAIDGEHDPSGRFFAGLVDQIVLVVRADADGENRIARLASRLGADAPKIRGAVLTGVAA